MTAAATFQKALQHHRVGELAEAVKLYRQAVKHSPRHVGAWHNLGAAMLSLGQPAGAIDSFRRAAELEPDQVVHWRGLTAALVEARRDDEAVDAWRDAARRHPESPELTLEWARALVSGRRIEEAIEVYRSILAATPSDLDALLGVAVLLERLGRQQEAQAAVQAGLAAGPDHPELNVLQARIERRSGQLDAARRRLEAVLAGPSLTPLSKGRASLELAAVLEAVGDYPAAFEAASVGQRALFSRLPPARRNLSLHLSVIARCKQVVSKSTVARWMPCAAASDSAGPIFVVGFPRSGTTLVEQMLAAHPNLVVTDELPLVQRVKEFLGDMYRKAVDYPEFLDRLSESQIAKARSLYFEEATRFLRSATHGRRIVDKQPLNTVDVGLIYRLFPTSPIVHVMRDPRDTCISCFTQAFVDGVPHLFELHSTAALLAALHDLWSHYRDVLPMRWMEMRYEDLVQDSQGQVRRLLEFVNEPWHDDVMRFFEDRHRRYVTTPSYADVARPVHSGSVGRWKRYEPQIAAILPTLESVLKRADYVKME